MSGRIVVGEHQGVYVIRYEGDVRVTLCGSFDHFLQVMLNNPEFNCVLVDLSDAIAIDSTSLGVLAKLSIGVQKKTGELPALICVDPGILRILSNMGFDDVFTLVDKNQHGSTPLAVLPVSPELTEADLLERVIDAHHVLMSMSERNQNAFKDLVAALESERSGSDASQTSQ